MGLWHAENSMSNQAIKAWMKSGRLTLRENGARKARSWGVIVYKSISKVLQGSVTHAFNSTVSTSGSERAVSLSGVKSKP